MRNTFFSISLFENKSTHTEQNLKHDSIYFCNLGKSNIGDSIKAHKERNFVNWYIQNIAGKNFTNVYHNVIDLADSGAAPKDGRNLLRIYHKELFFERSFKDCIKNLGLAIFFMSKICLKRDDFFLALFNLGGCIDSANAISNLKFTNLKTVVFNNSIGSIKPLWAISLERNNIFIDYCFYSTSSEPLDERKYKKKDGLWILSKWSRYIVFDELQKQDLQEQLSFHGKFQVANVLPWWSDIEFDIPDLGKPTISLFDSALHNQIYFRGTLNQIGWDSPEIALTYLRDVLEIAVENNLKIYYKNKRPRSIEMRNDEHFYGVLSLLAKYKNSVFEIDDRVAPIRLMKSSFLTISKPLSTTAVIAKSLGKPSVYFDPTGKIIPSDPSCRGCKVFKTKQELNKFIQSLLVNIKNSS
jgi:polysaccharide biosynthesis PFTS motif protein